MKQLGMIHICARGVIHKVPYFAEDEFARNVIAVRSHDAYDAHGLYVPYQAIDWMVRVPEGTQNTVDDLTESGEFGRGAMRQ